MRVKISQRWLIFLALVVLAVALAVYCLDYRQYVLYSYRGSLFSGPGRLAPAPVINLSPGSRTYSEQVSTVTVAGLYPRAGLTVAEAAIGALLIPFLLIIAALYLWLGVSTTRAGVTESNDAKATLAPSDHDQPLATPELPAPRLATDKREAVRRIAAVGAALFPTLLVLDLPSMMLLNCLRLPRWVFALLLLRTIAATHSNG